MRRRHLVAMSLLVLVLVAGFVTVGVARGPDPGDDRPTFKVLTFNLCGNVCNRGGNGSARFVASLARRTGTSTLLLQEACRSQVEVIDRMLGSTSHYVTSFSEDADDANRCPGDDYGIAVVTTARIEERFTLPLPNPGLGGRQLDERRLVCMAVDEPGGRNTVCTTHLVRPQNDAEAHAAQLTAVIAHAQRLAQRGRVVIGGDFNDVASAFASLTDGDYVTSPSRDRAIDRVFASRRHLTVGDATRYPCACSDHDAVVFQLRQREPVTTP